MCSQSLQSSSVPHMACLSMQGPKDWRIRLHYSVLYECLPRQTQPSCRGLRELHQVSLCPYPLGRRILTEIMAMEHVLSLPRLELCNYLHRLFRIQPNHILKPILIRHDTPPIPRSGQDLEIHQMDMHRMTPTTRAVFQFPDLGGSRHRLCEHTLCKVGEDYAVDGPHSVFSLEFEGAVNLGVGFGGEVESREAGRERTIPGLGRDKGADSELHYLVGMSVVFVLAVVSSILHEQGLACVGGKVDDNFIALGNGEDESIRADGRLKEASIGGNDVHRNLHILRSLEGEFVAPAQADITEPEAVLAWLDFEVWPWVSVDMNDISPVACRVTLAFNPFIAEEATHYPSRKQEIATENPSYRSYPR